MDPATRVQDPNDCPLRWEVLSEVVVFVSRQVDGMRFEDKEQIVDRAARMVRAVSPGKDVLGVMRRARSPRGGEFRASALEKKTAFHSAKRLSYVLLSLLGLKRATGKPLDAQLELSPALQQRTDDSEIVLDSATIDAVCRAECAMGLRDDAFTAMLDKDTPADGPSALDIYGAASFRVNVSDLRRCSRSSRVAAGSPLPPAFLSTLASVLSRPEHQAFFLYRAHTPLRELSCEHRWSTLRNLDAEAYECAQVRLESLGVKAITDPIGAEQCILRAYDPTEVERTFSGTTTEAHRLAIHTAVDSLKAHRLRLAHFDKVLENRAIARLFSEYTGDVRRCPRKYGFETEALAEEALSRPLSYLAESLCVSEEGYLLVDGCHHRYNQLCGRTPIPLLFIALGNLSEPQCAAVDSFALRARLRGQYRLVVSLCRHHNVQTVVGSLCHPITLKLKGVSAAVLREASARALLEVLSCDDVQVSTWYVEVENEDQKAEVSQIFHSALVVGGPFNDPNSAKFLRTTVVVHCKDSKFLAMEFAKRAAPVALLKPSDAGELLMGVAGGGPNKWALGRGRAFDHAQDVACSSTTVISSSLSIAGAARFDPRNTLFEDTEGWARSDEPPPPRNRAVGGSPARDASPHRSATTATTTTTPPAPQPPRSRDTPPAPDDDRRGGEGSPRPAAGVSPHNPTRVVGGGDGRNPAAARPRGGGVAGGAGAGKKPRGKDAPGAGFDPFLVSISFDEESCVVAVGSLRELLAVVEETFEPLASLPKGAFFLAYEFGGRSRVLKTDKHFATFGVLSGFKKLNPDQSPGDGANSPGTEPQVQDPDDLPELEVRIRPQYEAQLHALLACEPEIASPAALQHPTPPASPVLYDREATAHAYRAAQQGQRPGRSDFYGRAAPGPRAPVLSLGPPPQPYAWCSSPPAAHSARAPRHQSPGREAQGQSRLSSPGGRNTGHSRGSPLASPEATPPLYPHDPTLHAQSVSSVRTTPGSPPLTHAGSGSSCSGAASVVHRHTAQFSSDGSLAGNQPPNGHTQCPRGGGIGGHAGSTGGATCGTSHDGSGDEYAPGPFERPAPYGSRNPEEGHGPTSTRHPPQGYREDDDVRVHGHHADWSDAGRYATVEKRRAAARLAELEREQADCERGRQICVVFQPFSAAGARLDEVVVGIPKNVDFTTFQRTVAAALGYNANLQYTTAGGVTLPVHSNLTLALFLNEKWGGVHRLSAMRWKTNYAPDPNDAAEFEHLLSHAVAVDSKVHVRRQSPPPYRLLNSTQQDNSCTLPPTPDHTMGVPMSNLTERFYSPAATPKTPPGCSEHCASGGGVDRITTSSTDASRGNIKKEFVVVNMSFNPPSLKIIGNMEQQTIETVSVAIVSVCPSIAHGRRNKKIPSLSFSPTPFPHWGVTYPHAYCDHTMQSVIFAAILDALHATGSWVLEETACTTCSVNMPRSILAESADGNPPKPVDFYKFIVSRERAAKLDMRALLKQHATHAAAPDGGRPCRDRELVLSEAASARRQQVSPPRPEMSSKCTATVEDKGSQTAPPEAAVRPQAPAARGQGAARQPPASAATSVVSDSHSSPLSASLQSSFVFPVPRPAGAEAADPTPPAGSMLAQSSAAAMARLPTPITLPVPPPPPPPPTSALLPPQCAMNLTAGDPSQPQPAQPNAEELVKRFSTRQRRQSAAQVGVKVWSKLTWGQRLRHLVGQDSEKTAAQQEDERKEKERKEGEKREREAEKRERKQAEKRAREVEKLRRGAEKAEKEREKEREKKQRAWDKARAEEARLLAIEMMSKTSKRQHSGETASVSDKDSSRASISSRSTCNISTNTATTGVKRDHRSRGLQQGRRRSFSCHT
ncbi:hypothetical protein DIPPA_33538 [Diplonema papillatum]|nr:hypothetical protein DIPPA_33538 [Diplonema papillatum]KAJ9456702.1 hypothetical protein DIPPA_33538 [Diplonema papillatum]